MKWEIGLDNRSNAVIDYRVLVCEFLFNNRLFLFFKDDNQTSTQKSGEESKVVKQLSSQSSCSLADPGMNVSVFDGSELIKNFSMKFPHDTILRIRCVDIGRFQLIGPREIICQNGQWSSDQAPVCEGLSQEYDFDRKFC